VYFDLDGTLIRFDREFDAVLETTIEAAVGRVERGWADDVGEYFWRHFQAFEDDPYRRAFADFFEATGLEADPGEVARQLIANELAATTVDPVVRETVERLAGANERRTGVLTNGVGEVQREKLLRHDLVELFEAVLVSYEVGAHKPDGAIFETARDRIRGGPVRDGRRRPRGRRLPRAGPWLPGDPRRRGPGPVGPRPLGGRARGDRPTVSGMVIADRRWAPKDPYLTGGPLRVW